jgi:hypothetical protein
MSLFKSLRYFIPFGSSNSQPSQPSQPSPSFSMIEIDGKLYYLSSLDIDDCITNYSHTMTTALLKTITTYATGLSNQKITTIVFENVKSLPDPASVKTEPPPVQEKKVVGFWNPQLSKFVLYI